MILFCPCLERKPVDSDNSSEDRRLGSAKCQQPASSVSATGDALESGSEHKSRNASTDDLSGHADVTGSSDVLPLRSVSNSGSLYTRMRNYPAEGGSGDNEGDLLDSLLRVASTTAGGGGPDGSGLALRRRRRSNATELEAAGIRERTLSPVCVGGVNDLGQRMAVRRRSLPTPHLTVRDVALATGTTTPLHRNDESSESRALGRLQTSGNIAADSTSVSARDDDSLSDIDENVATTTTVSAVSDVSRTTKNPKADISYNDDISAIDKSSVQDSCVNLNREIDGNAHNGQESVKDVETSSRPRSQVDAVQPNTNISESSTNSELRQTQSTVDVDVMSSTCLPRRTQSLKLYRVRARSAARGELESQQLDANVHEFQTRAAPEREALRNRLRKLSLVYASSTDSDETSRTWPASRRPCADADQGRTTTTTAIQEIPLRCGEVVSASSSTSTLQLKYDTDSLSSQKDEGFETASISSDVYLSSSQRSSMCECDGAPSVTSTQERRTDPTTTASTVENLPPPPASFLSGPELIGAETPRSSGETCSTRNTESLVLPRTELEPVELDVEHHPSAATPATPLSVVNTEEKRLSEASTESRDRRVLSGSNNASVRRPAQTVATRQAVKPAPAAPRRTSSLLAPSTPRGSTRSAVAVTTKQAATVKPSIRPSSVNTASTSGLSAPFQRSSTTRTEDGRKLMSSGRTIAPQAFVRQSQTRATIAAPVLRTNKRAAAESRRMKEAATAAAATTKAPSTTTRSSDGPPSRQTTASNLATDRHRIRQRTSSSGSCSSTTSASVRSKLSSFRGTVKSETTRVSRQAAASANVPCATSKKPDGAAASSSSKTSSNLRRSTQPTNTRLRAPLITKKHCT